MKKCFPGRLKSSFSLNNLINREHLAKKARNWVFYFVRNGSVRFH